MPSPAFRHPAVAIAAACLLLASASAGASPGTAPRNLVVQAASAPVKQAQRLALVIGNSAYREAPLANPVNDARAMAETLEAAGFTVMLHTDVDLRGLHAAVREFGDRLRQAGVGLFYFAGHGMQIKGRNYLIPVGVDIQREDEVAYSALDAQAILDKMESAGNGTNLMLLDACRNNPFARSFRSSTQGLAHMDAPVGTLVAFSTAPGTVASDGTGRHGLYTQHLLDAMRKPGNKVEDVFKQVRAAVRRASKGKQIPWEATSLEGDLYFFEARPVVAAAPVVAPPPAPTIDAAALDDALWQTLKDSRDAAVMQAYLDRFPAGRHADAARRRLADLQPGPATYLITTPPAIVTAPVPAAADPVAGPAATAAIATPPAAASTRERWNPGADWEARKRLLEEQAARPAAVTAPTAPPTATPAPAHDGTWTADAVVQARKRVLDEQAARIPPASPAAGGPDKSELAPLQEPPGSDAATSAAPPGAVGATTAAAGVYSLGDAWTYREVDRWTNQPPRVFRQQVIEIDRDGNPHLDANEAQMDPIAQFLRQLRWPAAHGFQSLATEGVWWAWMRPGDSHRVKVAGLLRNRPAPVEAAIRLQHKGRERVQVQAGSFDTHRLEVSGTNEWTSPQGARVQQHWSATAWYAHEARGPVALEMEMREPGGMTLARRTRSELLSFDPAPPAVAHR